MAPMAIYEPHSLKRTGSQAQFDNPIAKKQDRGELQHHKAKWDTQKEHRRDAHMQDEKVVESLLSRSISLALETVGFGTAEAGALEGFRLHVEEYMAIYLSDVRQSMLSCRRREATPQDFLQALHTHQLSLKSLHKHLDPPVAPARSQFVLDKDVLDSEATASYQPLRSFFGGPETDEAKPYIPSHFPVLPDRHTYQATPDFITRERDPRKLREKATQEGRLGEEALRKLVTAGGSSTSKPRSGGAKPLTLREQRDQLWTETLASVAQEQQQVTGDSMDVDTAVSGLNGASQPAVKGHLSTGVNADKQYWRKPVRRKEV